MKTRGIIAAWLSTMELAPDERESGMVAALQRTLSGRSPDLIQLYRQEISLRLPHSSLRERMLDAIDSQLRNLTVCR